MDNRVSPSGPRSGYTFDVTVPAGGWSVPAAAGLACADFTVAAGPIGTENGIALTDCIAVNLPAGVAPALDVGLYFAGAHPAVAAAVGTQGQVTLRFGNLTAAPIVIAAATVFHCSALKA